MIASVSTALAISRIESISNQARTPYRKLGRVVLCEGRLILVCPKARQPESKARMASAAVRALAKVRTPRVTLEQLTGEVADRRRAGAYLHGVLPPLLARMAVSLEDGAPASLAGLPAFDELIAWYGASAAKISEVSPPPEWATWRRKPSATFLEREAKFGDALDEVREAGRAVRAKVFGALDDGGWLHRAPAASDEVDAFLSDFYARGG